MLLKGNGRNEPHRTENEFSSFWYICLVVTSLDFDHERRESPVLCPVSVLVLTPFCLFTFLLCRLEFFCRKTKKCVSVVSMVETKMVEL